MTVLESHLGSTSTSSMEFANGNGSFSQFELSSTGSADTNDNIVPKQQGLLKSPTATPVTPKKTVSFLTASVDKTVKVIEASDCINHMRDGSELLKIRSNGRQFKRFFFLDAESMEIRWNSSSKKRHKAKLSVDDLREVRTGRGASLRETDGQGQYPPECAFSIIYGSDYQSMDLVALTADEANIWVTGLTCLIMAGDSIEQRQLMRDRWLEEVFSSASVDDDGFLGEHDVIQLMKKLNSGVNTTRIRRKLKEGDTQRSNNPGRLSSSDFVNLFKEISTRPEMYFLLVRYSSEGDYLSLEDLLLFMEAEQGNSKVTKEKCAEIINRFEPSTEGKEKAQLGVDGFTAFLLSEHGDIFDPEHTQVCQEMTLPLNHYFINSSHNTYLIEDQLKGASSIEGYERVLKSGTRYIELEVWNGPDDEPQIYHGHTLTTKILCKDALECIHKYAFFASEYPLILSIEIHCNLTQQLRIVEYLKSIFGVMLFTPSSDFHPRDTLPSPHNLKRRVLLKAVRLPCNERIASDTDIEHADYGFVSEEDENLDIDRERAARSKQRHGSAQSTKKLKLCKELSALVYLESVRFLDLESASRFNDPTQVFTISESSSLRLSNGNMDEFMNHTKTFLTKVKPNAIRVDSSNYNPQDMWNCGCQMVALNHQTHGLMMDLNRSFFSRNGGCGYVIKPAVMRESLTFFSFPSKDSSGLSLPGISPHTLHIRVISGSHLPKPRAAVSKGEVTDPYVVLEMFGLPADCVEERTKTVPGNGYNPIFDESFEFQISLPEMAFLRILVLDDDAIGDDFIGQCTIPFECLQTGYRHIKLCNTVGEIIPNAHLFVHVAITNRLGGGKVSRRSASKKKKNVRDYPNLKTTGIRDVDDLFKTSLPCLKEAFELRESFHCALDSLKESCGLSHIANIKQCVRVISARASFSGTNETQTPLRMICKANYPFLEALVTLPDTLKKSVSAFEVLVNESKRLIQFSSNVHQKLLSIEQSEMSYYEDLPSLCSQSNFKSRKATKVMESFCWNIRVLKGQSDLLTQACETAHNLMRQAEEAGEATGLAMTEV